MESHRARRSFLRSGHKKSAGVSIISSKALENPVPIIEQ